VTAEPAAKEISMDDVLALDGTGQADLIRRKEVSAIELLEATIARIERINRSLNAVVTPMYDLARRTAAGPIVDAPFAGVPFLLKDLLAEYAGVPLTEASDFLSDFVPGEDSELVVRLERAGFVVAGKTNTPELGILPTTEPRRFGPTRNPWAVDRTPGGSSGGSAAAVAARLVPVAHANDGGGSIRIPASCCGVFGLKPSHGRNPLGPNYADVFGGLVSEHVVSVSVRDSARVLDATAGPDHGGSGWGRPERPFAAEVGADPGRLRIAFSTASPTGVPVHADCVAAVQGAATLCADLGHEVTADVPLPVDGREVGRAFAVAWSSGTAWSIDDWARRTGRTPDATRFEPLTWALAERGRRWTAADYLLARQDMQRAARTIARFFADVDVWLSPVLAEPPVPLGTFDAPADDPTRALRRAGTFAPFTFLANVTGQPAMSVPLAWNAGGLPIGVQFMARFGDEATLLRLAAQLEAARPWAHRRPPLPGA
jgi:amidase